jgi:hypothetical protein
MEKKYFNFCNRGSEYFPYILNYEIFYKYCLILIIYDFGVIIFGGLIVYEN